MNSIDIVINEIIKSPACYGEGFSRTAYWDKWGKCWSVGYGATGPEINAQTVWSEQMADADLRARLNRLQTQVLEDSPILLRESAYKGAAILDLYYNGGRGLYVGHSLKPLVDTGNWGAASHEIMLFDHAGGRELPGLKARREVESRFLLM